MTHLAWPMRISVSLLVVAATTLVLVPVASPGPKQATYWQVDEVRVGMKGYGCSVFKGSKIERFDAEVLGVLSNTSPGRDLVLVRLSGCNLDTSGVIAGMSGSPVYIEGKLLGAVAYAWAFGKEPIAGVTPFCQMAEYVESYERQDIAKKAAARRVQLEKPIRAGGRIFNTVTVFDWPGDSSCPNSGLGAGVPKREFGNEGAEPAPASADGLWLVPLKTPLIASGFTQHSLNLLAERTRWTGLMPMQAGGASKRIKDDEKDTPLQPGSPLAVSLVTGDFDLSGIGTVTHIDGERVYGWGHPFLSIGACEFPLMSGYIHTIYPRQSVSFKMGSPLNTLGVINADVSTCIAGWLGRKPDLMPLHITACREPNGTTKTFRCEVVRQKMLLPQLVFAALTNSVDMEGDLPDELTAEMTAKFEFEDRPTVVIHDTYSGPSYAGGRAPMALYSQIVAVAQLLTNHPFEPVRIKRIECDTRLTPGRATAQIDATQLDSEIYSPGDTLKATVFLKPWKGTRQRIPVQLKLPRDLPEGNYTALICDDLTNARYEIRESPVLNDPKNVNQVFQALNVIASAKRTRLAVRVTLNDVGVALDGQELPNLPSSMVEMLANSRRSGAETMSGALVSKHSTDWVVQGSHTIRFAVAKNKRLTTEH